MKGKDDFFEDKEEGKIMRKKDTFKVGKSM